MPRPKYARAITPNHNTAGGRGCVGSGVPLCEECQAGLKYEFWLCDKHCKSIANGAGHRRVNGLKISRGSVLTLTRAILHGKPRGMRAACGAWH